MLARHAPADVKATPRPGRAGGGAPAERTIDRANQERSWGHGARKVTGFTPVDRRHETHDFDGEGRSVAVMPHRPALAGEARPPAVLPVRVVVLDPATESLRATRLDRAWYQRDALIIARALIGCLVVHERPGGPARVSRIVETEAYRGPKDLACHARAGLTKRTRSLLGTEGHAYVFLIYGMHECFNVTCAGEGRGHAVLVRGAEPIAGLEPGDRLDGPGRFARAMTTTRALDGHDLTTPPLYLCARPRRPRVAVSARVGVGYAGAWADRPWRFYDPTSAHVSRPAKSAIGRGPGREAVG
jgi:DNA-3-methyladenine glycosylase